MKKLFLAATVLVAISTSAQTLEAKSAASLVTDTFDILSKIPTSTYPVGPSGPAHAQPTMPDVMIGNWCAKKNQSIYDKDSKGVGVYQRIGKDEVEGCGTDVMTIKPHEFIAWVEDDCTPIIVQHIFRGNYLIRAKCAGEGTSVITDIWLDFENDEIDGYSLRFVPMNKSKSWFINFMEINWYVLDEHCRGDSNLSGKEYNVCDDARHSVTLVLNNRGYCYGKYNQSHAEMEWHKCTRNSYRGEFWK